MGIAIVKISTSKSGGSFAASFVFPYPRIWRGCLSTGCAVWILPQARALSPIGYSEFGPELAKGQNGNANLRVEAN